MFDRVENYFRQLISLRIRQFMFLHKSCNNILNQITLSNKDCVNYLTDFNFHLENNFIFFVFKYLLWELGILFNIIKLRCYIIFL